MPKDAEVGWLEGFLGKWWARMIVNRFVLFPMQLYPFVGLAVSAWMRAYGTSRYLHSKYFKSKNMTSAQISVYMEERKWDYRREDLSITYRKLIPIPFFCSLRVYFCHFGVDSNHWHRIQRLQSNWCSYVGSR